MNSPIGNVSLATNQAGERVIKISFPYDSDTLMKVRTLVGRKYHAESKVWSAPLYDGNIQKLKGWGFNLSQDITDYLVKTAKKRAEAVNKSIKGLKNKLFPFQSVGVQFIESHNGRALIADEMGLGKTIQALAWLQMHPELLPAIIIVPASLKLNWEREARTWTSYTNIEILCGTKTWTTTGDILIINYDILFDWLDKLKEVNPKVIITDECHYYKSNLTKRTKAVKMLSKGVPHIIALSGTPIINRPIEAFNAINLIQPGLFKNYWTFTQRYCGAKHNGYGWNFNGASHIEELHQILVDTIMIRRLKKDVMADLPEKMYSFVPLELRNRMEYNEAKNHLISYLKATKGKKASEKAKSAEVLVRIETLKQLAVKGVMHQCLDWIQNFIEIDGKLVVFGIHKFVIEAICNAFPKVHVRIDGTTPPNERQKAVDQFQNNPDIRLFIGNIQAAGIGITLTASSNVAFLELPWTPGALRQAIDRVHRIGQKSDSVNVYYLFALDTIMDYLAELINNKQKILDAVLDGKETDDTSMLSILVEKMLNS